MNGTARVQIPGFDMIANDWAESSSNAEVARVLVEHANNVGIGMTKSLLLAAAYRLDPTVKLE